MADSNPILDEEQFYTDLVEDLESGQLTLPTLPEVAMEVRNIVNDPEASASDMATIIATDPALSAQVLKVANSPMFRSAKEIDSIQRAIAILGTNLIRNVVTGLMMKQMFHASSSEVANQLRTMWEQNTQIAAYSQLLATTCDGIKPDEAMLAGLIHNIGALPIMIRADESPELVSNKKLLGNLINKLSCRIGKTILEQWEFPQELSDVAAYHLDLSRDKQPQPDLVDVVQVAMLQTYMGTDHLFGQVDWDSVPAANKLGIANDIEEIELEGCTEKIEAAREMLM